MDAESVLKNDWPMLALIAWFGYKWWSLRRVVGLFMRSSRYKLASRLRASRK